MTLTIGAGFLVLGAILFAMQWNKPKDWNPRFARFIVLWWGPTALATARVKVRAVAYIAMAFGVLQVLRATWFGA